MGSGAQLNEIATGRPEEIYLFFTNHAFALPGLQIVTEGCHNAYARFYEQLGASQHGDPSAIPLHLSTKWEGRFDDLVLYTARKFRKVHEIRSILLFGTMLKILTIREMAGRRSTNTRLVRPETPWLAWVRGALRSRCCKGRKEKIHAPCSPPPFKPGKGPLSASGRTAYYWCVQAALNSPEMTPLLPEYNLLNNKLDDLYNGLLAQGVDAGALDLDQVPEEQRFEHIRNNPELGLE